MEFSQLMNTIILALSVATILITLVAYIMYQLRRMQTPADDQSHRVKLEGVFFRRFAPHLEARPPGPRSQTKSKLPAWIQGRRLHLVALFLLLALILFLSFFSELLVRLYGN